MYGNDSPRPHLDSERPAPLIKDALSICQSARPFAGSSAPLFGRSRSAYEIYQGAHSSLCPQNHICIPETRDTGLTYPLELKQAIG
jgi:hypothetical protein